jgi:hypothetical protein
MKSQKLHKQTSWLAQYTIKPTVYRDSHVTARIPNSLFLALESERQRLGISRSELVFKALDSFLKRA